MKASLAIQRQSDRGIYDVNEIEDRNTEHVIPKCCCGYHSFPEDDLVHEKVPF